MKTKAEIKEGIFKSLSDFNDSADCEKLKSELLSHLNHIEPLLKNQDFIPYLDVSKKAVRDSRECSKGQIANYVESFEILLRQIS